MRVTENMRFNTVIGNLFNNRAMYNDLTEKLATQKKVNRASDDPLSATRIITIRQSKAAIGQYTKNIDSCKTWLSATESTLTGASSLLDTAKGIAVGAVGADPPTREVSAENILSAENIQAIIESMRNLANTKWGDRYLFSGSQTSTQPFSTVENPPIIGDAVKAGGNVYAGGVASSAAFTGLADKTYTVEIVDGGNLSAATYRISSDGGLSWGTEKDDLDTGTIYLADGIKLTFTPGTFVAGDTFSVDAHAATGIIDAPAAAGGNGYAGTVSSGAAYTGDVNKTCAVKITTEGLLGAATYQFSSDGGRTWNGADLSMAGGVVNLGDGVRMTFDDDAFGTNDIFYVNATAAGYYQGNDESLSMTINRDTVFEYSITGAEAFTAAGGVDIFETLTALKDALINNDSDEIIAQRLNIEQAQGQILLCESKCGMKASHLEVVSDNLSQFDETLNFLLSNARDADTTELAAKLMITETSLKSSYAIAGKIGEFSILNYLT